MVSFIHVALVCVQFIRFAALLLRLHCASTALFAFLLRCYGDYGDLTASLRRPVSGRRSSATILNMFKVIAVGWRPWRLNGDLRRPYHDITATMATLLRPGSP